MHEDFPVKLPEEIHKDYAYEALSDERDVLKKRLAELEKALNKIHNNTLDLCKRLKEAGFPQPTWGGKDFLPGNVWVKSGDKEPILIHYERWYGPDETLIAYEPTPIELEEAVIGEMGKNLLQINISYDRNYSEWRYWAMANHSEDNKQSKDINRFTAIAELYLKIRGM